MAGRTTYGLTPPPDPDVVSGLATAALAELPARVDALPHLHAYVDDSLKLAETMSVKLKQLSPEEFEGLLHPIFQEDETTLTVAGGVLGALAGGWQLIYESWAARRAARRGGGGAAEAAARGDAGPAREPGGEGGAEGGGSGAGGGW